MSDKLKINLTDRHEMETILEEFGYRQTKDNIKTLISNIKEKKISCSNYNKWKKLKEKNAFIKKCLYNLEKK